MRNHKSSIAESSRVVCFVASRAGDIGRCWAEQLQSFVMRRWCFHAQPADSVAFHDDDDVVLSLI